MTGFLYPSVVSALWSVNEVETRDESLIYLDERGKL